MPEPRPLAAIETGVAGGSARTEEKRRLAKREADNKERWGERVGGWVTRLGAVPHSTAAWGIGAQGEELLAVALASVPELVVLHDRRVPGTRGNIDHIVIAPAGVFVVDAKHYVGLIEVRDRGGLFRTDLRLMVGRRDKSKLARAMGWQVDAITAALAEARVDPTPPITPVLCFIEGEWPFFRRPASFEGVRLESDRSIAKLFTASTLLDAAAIDEVARAIARELPPKVTTAES